MTAAQQRRSASKNKYKMLYPFEAKIKTKILNNNISLLTLFFISFPMKYLFISFPFIIIKLEIALISVSIVLNVNTKAKINIIIITKLLLEKIKLKNAKSGFTLGSNEKDIKPV